MNLSIIPPQSIVAMKSIKSSVHEVSVGDDSIFSDGIAHSSVSIFLFYSRNWFLCPLHRSSASAWWRSMFVSWSTCPYLRSFTTRGRSNLYLPVHSNRANRYTRGESFRFRRNVAMCSNCNYALRTHNNGTPFASFPDTRNAMFFF